MGTETVLIVGGSALLLIVVSVILAAILWTRLPNKEMKTK